MNVVGACAPALAAARDWVWYAAAYVGLAAAPEQLVAPAAVPDENYAHFVQESHLGTGSVLESYGGGPGSGPGNASYYGGNGGSAADGGGGVAVAGSYVPPTVPAVAAVEVEVDDGIVVARQQQQQPGAGAGAGEGAAGRTAAAAEGAADTAAAAPPPLPSAAPPPRGGHHGDASSPSSSASSASSAPLTGLEAELGSQLGGVGPARPSSTTSSTADSGLFVSALEGDDEE